MHDNREQLDAPHLIEAVARGRDRRAFATLFEFFGPRVKGYLMRGGLPGAAAEELAQETLLTLWRKAELFDRTRAGASAWVFAIARNLRIDMQRRGQRARLYDSEAFDEPEEPERPDHALVAVEREKLVRAALTQLSSEQMRVVELSFFEGKPHGEIASSLGVPLGTVKSRLRLAMQRLRSLLIDLT
jgi:RNA polymerase sigma-70 factor (ECF subfamily)